MNRFATTLALAAGIACAVFGYEPQRHNDTFTTNGVTYAQRGGLGASDYVVTNIDASAVVPYDMIAPEWETNTTYGIGSICIYNGKLYQKKRVPTSLIPPADDPATWELASIETVRSSFHQELVQDYVPRNIYAWPHNTSETYNKGDLCFHDNLLYRCNKDNVRGTWYFEDWDNVRLADEVELKSIHSETPELGKWTISQNPNYGIPLYGLYYAPIGDEYGEAGLPSADTEVWWFDMTGAREGIWTTETSPSATSVSCVMPLAFPDHTEYITLTGTRTITYPVIAYQLGSNSDKFLQPKGDYALADDVAAAALAATNYTDWAIADANIVTPSMVTNIVIDVAPSPGDYATVSNKAMNAISRAEVEVGWWSEWAQSPDGPYHWRVEYTNGVWFIYSDEGGYALSTGVTDENATSVSFGQVEDITYTFTRHRVAAPVPTKPSDIGAASTTDATLTPIYGGNGERFGEWACNPATVDGLDLVVVDKSDEIPPLWGIEASGVGVVDELPYVADATNLFFANTGGGITATRTENPIIGYILGSQADKPLQPKGEYASADDVTAVAQAATNYTNDIALSIPNNITRTGTDATLVYHNGTTTRNLIYIRQATHGLAGLMTAADKTALDALLATAVTSQTVTNVVDEVKELHYDDELGVTWETRIIGGEMKFFAVTNTNISAHSN